MIVTWYTMLNVRWHLQIARCMLFWNQLSMLGPQVSKLICFNSLKVFIGEKNFKKK